MSDHKATKLEAGRYSYQDKVIAKIYRYDTWTGRGYWTWVIEGPAASFSDHNTLTEAKDQVDRHQ